MIFGDTIMSLVGGVTVFSVLGYLSQLTGKPIPEIVQSGSTLAFIVYPEAIATMPMPWLWNSLFFLMLFFLGITSEIGISSEKSSTTIFSARRSVHWHDLRLFPTN